MSELLRKPLCRNEARKLLGEDSGHLTVRVRIDQEAYLSGHARFLADSDTNHWDLLHDKAFSFGLPCDCEDTIVAVDGDDFFVDYTTDLTPFLA